MHEEFDHFGVARSFRPCFSLKREEEAKQEECSYNADRGKGCDYHSTPRADELSTQSRSAFSSIG